jgi:hypothetical protein
LQTLNENLRCTRDVIAAKRLRSRAIACDHGVEDRDVLAQDGLRHLSIVSQHLPHHTVQVWPVRSGCLTDQVISRQFVDEGVKTRVGFDLIMQ